MVPRNLNDSIVDWEVTNDEGVACCWAPSFSLLQSLQFSECTAPGCTRKPGGLLLSVGRLITIGDESRVVPSASVRSLSEGWLNVKLSVNRTENSALWATLLMVRASDTILPMIS